MNWTVALAAVALFYLLSRGGKAGGAARHHHLEAVPEAYPRLGP